MVYWKTKQKDVGKKGTISENWNIFKCPYCEEDVKAPIYSDEVGSDYFSCPNCDSEVCIDDEEEE